VTRLAVRGEIGHAGAPRWQRKLHALVQQGHTRLVIDFDGLDLVTPGTITFLVEAATHMREHGGDVAVCRSTPLLDRLFDLLQLDRLVARFPAAADAATHVRRGCVA
jgi:anti-sigma B factor antagonist